MGSFCPAAGTRNPHRDCNFAERVVETVPKSLRHSCSSELTRQGISLPYDRYSYGRRLPVLRLKASKVTPLTSPLNLPAPGRRQCIYGALCGLACTCVFAKQSLGPIH